MTPEPISAALLRLDRAAATIYDRHTTNRLAEWDDLDPWAQLPWLETARAVLDALGAEAKD